MICYAVIDTNVLVSALLSSNDDSATVQVLEKVIVGEITPVFSDAITNEYHEVLSRKKFNFSPAMVAHLLSGIEKHGISVTPKSNSTIILPYMKDLPFYEVVLEKRNDNAYLVTGNTKHFPKEPFIVTPRELLDILDEQK